MQFTAQYLWDHKYIILLEILSAGIFAGVFYLYHLPLMAVLYPAALSALLWLLFAGAAVWKAYRQHRRLEEMQYVSEESLRELCEENRGLKDKDYQRIIVNLCRERQRMQDEAAQARDDAFQYYTLWVHQIKTPIASMGLQLGTEDSALARRLRSELLHIEQYVEMVLTYLKMGSESTDYVFREVSLDKMIREAIRKFRGDFIIKKLRLVYEPVEKTVVSDEKWLSFVVEQILSNALKYTREGSVRIYMESPETLCIADTGIGIAPEDIPRIFEKGFTGGNGREDKRASGIGLYLCREICRRLGHRIAISSVVDEGTTVRIDLAPQSPVDGQFQILQNVRSAGENVSRIHGMHFPFFGMMLSEGGIIYEYSGSKSIEKSVYHTVRSQSGDGPQKCEFLCESGRVRGDHGRIRLRKDDAS